MIFKNRTDAGNRLASALLRYAGRPDVLVLGLPRGGMVVAYEVAATLHAPLDVMVVRKLGAPGREELAMGAVANGDVLVVNRQVVESLDIPDEVFQEVVAREREEVARRQRLYRDDRPPPEIRGRCVILVDDGLATGATMQAAVEALRQLGPASIVVAVPVAAVGSCVKLRPLVDEVVCLATPRRFFGVGQWYRDFSQTTDEEVRLLLEESWMHEASRAR